MISGSEMIRSISDARDFNLTQMTEHDLLEVVEIEESCGLSRWGWDAYHAELSQGRGAIMLVAHVGEGDAPSGGQRVKGFIAARLSADELHINNVAVRPKYRRTGVAKKLLESVIHEAARRGARAAFLEVRKGNTAAQALYGGCGFRMIGQRPGYYVQPLEDALVMSLALRTSA
jgi:[ribosomal protein S18]-alanine N-acetyltransferase